MNGQMAMWAVQNGTVKTMPMIFKGTVMLAVLVAVGALACDSLGIGGECYNNRTGEAIKEVEDANGKLWPVKKHPQSIRALGQDLDYCAVSLEAEFERSGSAAYGTDVVYHPDTGSPIDTQSFYDTKGWRMLDGHEWY